jgi:hypothetical protein
MNPLRCIILLHFTTTLSLGQPARQRNPIGSPEMLVRSFYTEVIVRHPHDIPNDVDMKVFAPLLQPCSDPQNRRKQGLLR